MLNFLGSILVFLFFISPNTCYANKLEDLINGKINKITYTTQEKEAAFENKLQANKGYIAIDAKVDHIATGEFNCSNSSFYRFFRNLLSDTDKTYLLEATFQINGITLNPVPLVLISVSNNTCKTISIEGERRVTPYVKVGANRDINVTYKIKYSDKGKINFQNSINLFNSYSILTGAESKIITKASKSAMDSALTGLQSEIGGLLENNVDYTYLTSFKIGDAKGIKIWDGKADTFAITFSVDPELSMFAHERKIVDDFYFPKYTGTTTSVLGEPILPKGFPEVYDKLSEHFKKDNLASSYYTNFKTSDQDSFSDRCNTLITYISNELAQNEFDSARIFHALSLNSKFKDGKYLADYGCGDNNETSDLLTQLGLTFKRNREPNKDDRDRTRKALNDMLTRFGNFSRYNEQITLEFLDKTMLYSSVSLVDQAKITSIPKGYSVDRNLIMQALSNIHLDKYGCYFNPPDEAVDSMNSLALTTIDGVQRKFIISYLFSSPDEGTERKVKDIVLLDAQTEGKDQVIMLNKSKDKSTSCGSLLKDHFSDI